MSESSSSTKHTCLKLQIPQTLFVKATWFHSHFNILITDGLNAWTCNASEDEVKERASNWDQPVSEYIDMSERYLGFQQPGSVYAFLDAGGGGFKRLSWTFEKEGTKLEWRWKFKPAENSKEITAGILDFLMDANIRLSEEVVMKTRSNEKLKSEAEKCLAQSEKFQNEKTEFETKIYSKDKSQISISHDLLLVAILNLLLVFGAMVTLVVEGSCCKSVGLLPTICDVSRPYVLCAYSKQG
ncbi:DNA repair protein XRCC4 [Tanacetum coccineum]